MKIRNFGYVRWIALLVAIMTFVLSNPIRFRVLAAAPLDYRPLARLTLGGEGFGIISQWTPPRGGSTSLAGHT